METTRENKSQQLSREWSERNGSIIKILRYGEHPFVQLLKTSVLDQQLSFAARGLHHALLTLPPDWQPHPKQLCRELGMKPHTWKRLMRELREHGYARQVQLQTGGSRIEVAEYPKWASTLARVRNPDSRDFKPFSSECTESNDPSVPQYYSKKDSYRGVSGETPISIVFRRPPESEQEMCATLEAHGIEPELDYDGGFFDEFANRDWTMPNGEPVYDWVALYEARIEHTTEFRDT